MPSTPPDIISNPPTEILDRERCYTIFLGSVLKAKEWTGVSLLTQVFIHFQVSYCCPDQSFAQHLPPRKECNSAIRVANDQIHRVKSSHVV